ncbi:AraC family transcriptional regulator [Pigmentiphaga litoralis]|uniref:AraC family transcriptional regulator n=1 Tax=Pigmentiphaga litoralis TaxID=516702 RepID=UPI00167B35AB|nr:AraC family transcriptional regulator [Pigmentiphaga litoralis]GGX37363.1 AraC family transcriptional regulator [Pigmentiphaga litoralis]
MDTLLDAVRRYTQSHAGADGVAQTPIDGLMLVRATVPSGLLYDISRPLVCLVLQGSKQVTAATHSVSFSAGDSLLIAVDVPTVSQITQASIAAPYLSLALVLDPAIIADLTGQMEVVRTGTAHGRQITAASSAGLQDVHRDGDAGSLSRDAALHVEPTEADVADVALRLVRLLERPAAVPVLQAQLVREMHYWLLAGRHGPAIRRLGWPEGHVHRIARAVAVLRADYAQPIAVERLATVAGMSPSSFHQHFRAVTSLSPLQFQKHLRLLEARRLMLTDGASASSAAFKVGYESVSQFTREYSRTFGQPPVRNVRLALNQATSDDSARSL